MANEFTKPVKIQPAVAGNIADPDEYNQNIAGQSKDSIVGIDINGNYEDFDLGDEAIVPNGALIGDVKLRDTSQIKIYDSIGALLSIVNFGQGTDSIIGTTFLPKQVTLSNGTDIDHDIDFTAGNFQFNDGTGQATVSALTKKIDEAWVIGDNQGGLDMGTVAANATYHMFAIHNPTSVVSDFLFSLSATSPTLPAGFTKKTRIASLKTNVTSNILPGKYLFKKDGSYHFEFNSKITNSTSLPSGLTNVTISTPSGIEVEAVIHMQVTESSGKSTIEVKSNVIGDAYTLARMEAANLGRFDERIYIWSDINSQIKHGFTVGGVSLYVLSTLGWIDNNL
jgi:hypothetical protein